MIHYKERRLRQYAVFCTAYGDAGPHSGCSDTGPWGLSQQEADELAREAGWQIIREDGVSAWACPAHVRAAAAEKGA